MFDFMLFCFVFLHWVRQKMVIVNTTVMVDKTALTAELQPSVEQMHRTILPLFMASLLLLGIYLLCSLYSIHRSDSSPNTSKPLLPCLQPLDQPPARMVCSYSGPLLGSMIVVSVLKFSETQISAASQHSINSGSSSSRIVLLPLLMTMNTPLTHFKELHSWKAKKTTNVTRKNLALNIAIVAVSFFQKI